MRIITLCIAALIALFLSNCQKEHLSTHQSEVAERGSQVMPFDLERSTHIFEKIEKGGKQHVLSDDNDAEQIQLIQEHMAEIAEQFSIGDFHNPEMIHGEQMAGLHELMQGYEQISVEYAALENGGQILYSTEDSAMVVAIHDWFDAQVSDHAHHAQDHH